MVLYQDGVYLKTDLEWSTNKDGVHQKTVVEMIPIKVGFMRNIVIEWYRITMVFTTKPMYNDQQTKTDVLRSS